MWNNLKKLLSSKKYQSAFGFSAAGLVYAIFGNRFGAEVTPEQIESVINGIVLLFGMAIGGNAAEDVARNLKSSAPKGTK